MKGQQIARRLAAVLFTAGAFSLAPTALANSGGIGGRSTAGCVASGCHAGGSFSYSVVVNGPDKVLPSATGVALSVGFNNGSNSAPKAGFNLSVTQGHLTPGSGQTKQGPGEADGDPPIREISHSTPQTANGSSDFLWSFTWSAPDSGSANFAVCANPVDGSFSTAGDGPHQCTTKTIAVNVAPTISGVDSVGTFTEDGSPSTIDGSISVADPDDANLNLAEVEISGNFSAGSDQLVCPTTVLACSVSGNRLTLSNTNTLSVYQSALSGVRFSNNSANPSTLTRTIQFRVRDAFNVFSSDVQTTHNVVAVNDPPVVSGFDAVATFTEGGAPVAIDATVAVADPDDTTVNRAEVEISGNFEAADSLPCPTGTGLTCSSSGSLLVLSGTASLSTYASALGLVTFTNSSQQPGTAPRTIRVRVRDAQNVFSAYDATTLGVAGVNDAPALRSLPPLRATAERAYWYQVQVADADDANDGIALSYELTGAPPGMSISPTGLIRWLVPAGAATVTGLVLTVRDGGENGVAPVTQTWDMQVLPQLDLAALGDVNGNGHADQVVMLKDASGLKAYVRDGDVGAAVRTLSFSSAFALLRLIDTGFDLNANGVAEIAALVRDTATGKLQVLVRDPLSGAVIKNIVYGSTQHGVALAVLDDLDGNDAPEIAVLSRNGLDGAWVMQTRDALTGVPSFPQRTQVSSGGTAFDLQAIGDIDGDGRRELAALVRDADGSVRVRVLDGGTGLPDFVLRYLAPEWGGLAMAVVPDINGNGVPEIAVLGRTATGRSLRVQTKDLKSRLQIAVVSFPAGDYESLRLVALPDSGGDGNADVAALLHDPVAHTNRINVRDASTGALAKLVNLLGPAFTATALVVGGDRDGNGVSELIGLATSATAVKSQARDAATGTDVLTVTYP